MSSAVSHFILATAGHVDHGKSALVKALTGTDPDRLPEEKARGITIDLGFAHLDLPNPEPSGPTLHLGIVDVPGHEDFVKNMVAGVGSIDVAMLVVAADDGWMPQTEEHLQILAYLGVTRAIVALNKIDLAPAGEATAIQRVRERLQGTPFLDAPIIPTSALTGDGLDSLKSALAQLLVRTSPAPDIGKPRLPIDRAFSLRGIGTIVTGTLSGGVLRRGQPVVIQPGNVPTRIRTLHRHGQETDSVGPATRTALNLADVSLAEKGSDDPSAVRRGQVVTLPELGVATDTWNVFLERSARPIHHQEAATARLLRDGSRVRVHHGSGNAPARLLLGGTKEIAPGQQTLAQLRFETPVFGFAGDRFVIRDASEQRTLAGGVILDPDACRRSFRAEAQGSFLQRRSRAPGDVAVALETLLERDQVLRSSTALLKSHFSASEVASILAEWQAAGQIVATGDFIVTIDHWNVLRAKAAQAIDAFHRAHPEQPGMPVAALRAALEPERGGATLFEPVVASLLEAGFTQTGTAVKRASHHAVLPPGLQAAGARVRAALSARPFEPPSKKELAPDSATQQALRFLIQTGEAVELGSEVVLLTESYSKAAERVRQHLRDHGSATVSDLRPVIGTTRRILVPLLERLDREGVTLRQGDRRVLR